MLTKDRLDSLIAITPVILMVLFLNLGINLNFDLNIKIDTIVLVFGNLLIAVYITAVLNKKHKNYELKIESCYKELDRLEDFLKILRETPPLVPNEYIINRQSSLVNLQISLISKYNFIKDGHIKKLKNYYTSLDKELTGDNTVDQNYMNTILQFEKRILVIKSDIL
jgi:hypothetical protein